MAWNSIKRLFGLDAAPVEKTGGQPADAARKAPLLDEGEADFAFAVSRARGVSGNAVFSPASARLALGMALLGARGETAEELLRALKIAKGAAGEGSGADAFQRASARRTALWSDASKPYSLVSANALFVAEALRFRPEGKERLQGGYLAPIRPLDFAFDPARSAAEINAWVKETTRGLVPEIAPPGAVTTGTRLVIANALYFKAEWRTKFLHDATHPAPFEVLPGERREVAMMQQTAQHRAWIGPEAEVLELAYRGDDLAMTFLLPPRGTALADFEAGLSGGLLASWLSRLTDALVRVTLPRFSIDGGAMSLRAPLESLGARAPFDASAADFGALFDDPIVLDDILHRARIDVDEQGTEAAAATAVFARQSMDRRQPVDFVIDRPFLFLLRDLRDGGVLFFGRVVDPR